MRHFVLAAFSPCLLTPGMTSSPTPRALVAPPGSSQRLASPDPRTFPGAVDVAVIAAGTDAHLYAAALTVVEPIGRLAARPQRPHSPVLDSTGLRQA